MAGESVLIVEDEVITQDLLRGYLEDRGFEVVGTATSGGQALESADDSDLDVVLMDIKLGGSMDGIETARKLKENHDVVLIYLTAYSDPGFLERAKDTRPAGYLIKPVEKEELYCSMEIALSNRKLQEERNQALREKEELLDQIRTLVDRNASILSELQKLQKLEDPERTGGELEEKGREALQNLFSLRNSLDENE